MSETQSSTQDAPADEQAVKEKLRAELIRWMWATLEEALTDEELDGDAYDAFEKDLKAWACRFVGAHQPERDQCGIPAHDYCHWCGTSTPGAASSTNEINPEETT